MVASAPTSREGLVRFLVWYLGLVFHLFALWYAADNMRELVWFWWASLAVWCVVGLGLLVRGVLRAVPGGARWSGSGATPPRARSKDAETQAEVK